ncbi:hypothetical protein Anapl_03354 [Anas platyrhynchos]|uniref:Uncharacterized protein n=1 Tax=Anas platyrhynchos TaxID=8839 RepID=R0K4J2_ANAPL|nr:hypothetical protein Anapl_03354 [Anas platyrhynchos]
MECFDAKLSQLPQWYLNSRIAERKIELCVTACTNKRLLRQGSGSDQTVFMKCNGSMSSQKLSVPYCSWGSTQTPVSASSILENAKSYDNEVFGIERPKRNFQQDSWLEEKFYKALETPLTVMYNRAFPDKAVKCYKAYIYLSPQYTVEQEERISITELLSGIDTVSRALKNEKKEKFSSLSDKRLSLQTQKKEKKNVTHLEDFGAFCDCTKDPGSREVLKAVICIQRYVRGWLVRRAFKRVKIKSASHGPSLLAVVSYYRKMMTRIKHRAGVLDLSTPLHYFELEEWMDKKKFYEAMFFKRELDKKMDRKQLSEFFRDCGYFIPASGIHQVFQLVSPASTASVRSIKKHQAIEMAFTLFPPLGAKVKNVVTVPLPWLHPLLDGKVGSKKAACVTFMYENEIHVTVIDGIIGIINEFADITLPVKIHFFNDKHMCLDDIPIKYSA